MRDAQVITLNVVCMGIRLPVELYVLMAVLMANVVHARLGDIFQVKVFEHTDGHTCGTFKLRI